MISAALDVVSWVLLSVGALVLVLGGWVILRMPDFFARIHAASVNETLGPGLILLGLILQAEGRFDVTVKLMLILVFLVLTGPASSHALARAAVEHGLKPHGYPDDGTGERPDELDELEMERGGPPSTP